MPRHIKAVLQDGDRTKLHINSYHTIKYKERIYTKCGGGVDFTESNANQLFSQGTGREVILLDSHNLEGLYQAFKKTVSPDAHISDIFRTVITFSNQKIQQTNDVKAETREIEIQKYPDTPYEKRHDQIILMSEVVNQQTGVCRHHALFTAFLLGRYFKDHPRTGLSIHHYRSDLDKGGAHAWVLCQFDGKQYFIDSMWRRQYCVNEHDGRQGVLKEYGSNVLKKMLERIKKPGEDHKSKILNQLARGERSAQAFFKSLNDTDCQNLWKMVLNNFASGIREDENFLLIKKFVKYCPNRINLNELSTNGRSAVHYAVENDDLALMRDLIKGKANINQLTKQSKSPPIFYVKTPEMLNLLVQHGADLLLKNKAGKTLEQIIKEPKLKQAIEDLKKKQSKITASELVAALKAGKLDENTLRESLSAKEKSEYEGFWKSCLSCIGTHVDRAYYLVVARVFAQFYAKKSIIDLAGKSGQGAVHFAALYDDIPFMEVLIRAGANINLPSRNSANPPLFYVKSEQMLWLLMANGADLKATNGRNETFKKRYADNVKFQQIYDEAVQGKNAQESVIDPNEQVLKALLVHIEEQIKHLDRGDIFQKGKLDKQALYKRLEGKINDTLLFLREKTPARKELIVKSLIYETATISHHRRRRTRDKCLFFIGGVEAQSWKAYKTMIAELENKIQDAQLKFFLTQSLKINEEKMSVMYKETVANAGFFARGYDDYRAKIFADEPALNKTV